MKLKIYNQQGVLKATVSPSDSDRHVKEVMNDNVLNLSFTLYEYVGFGVNDYVEFEGERFSLLEDYKPEQNSGVEYVYNCKFYGIESELKKAKVLKLVDNENELSFSYDATAAEHLQLICDNINRIKGGNAWVTGEVVSTGNVNIEYDNKFCFDALTDIAKNFDTEWWIEGSTINLSRCEHGTAIPMGYGKGLLKLSRVGNNTVPFFTRLYPLGSTRNIVQSDYGHKRLQLPGGVRYVEKNTYLGIVEQSEENAFSGIYPRRTGKVSAVRSAEETGEDGNKFTIYYFTDSSLDFDPNDYEIEGLVKNIVFQSGELNGRDFEVNFDTETKEFEIITQFPYENQQLPGGLLIPEPGDEYILYNIRMPQEYYPLAEQEYAEAVTKYLDKISIDTSVYKAPTDYIYLEENRISLKIGRRVLLESKIYFPSGTHESRITKISRKLNNPCEADIECTYAVDYGRISQIENNIVDIKAAYKEQLNRHVLQILKTWDSADPSEYNVLSALRAYRDFLSRLDDDVAYGTITFMRGLIGKALSKFLSGIHVEGGADIDYAHVAETLSAKLIDAVTVNTGQLTATEADINILDVLDRFTAKDGRFSGKLYSADYVQAMLGWIIHADGSAEMKGLRLREFLEVPELRYNRVSVITGEQWSAPGGGIIESVDAKNCILYLKLEPGELAAVELDDICKGTFNNDTGFQTAFFRITEKLGDSTFKYALRGGYEYNPQKAMHFVAYGNFTNKDRQASAYITRKYTRYLRGVNTWEISKNMITMQFGDLSNLKAFGIEMEGYSAYLKNIYLTGTIRQLSSDGVTETPVPAFKGEWKAGTYYPNDEVTHEGSTWLCISEKKTTQEPTEDATDWLETSAKGKDAIVVEIFSSNGNIFRNGAGGTTLTAQVRKGDKDVTEGIPPTRFSWEKESSNADTDTIFNETHVGHGPALEVTPDDVWARATFNCIVSL